MFKFYRLSALLYVFKHLKDAVPEARVWPSCLALGAYAIHQLDALLHRPASQAQHLRLLECCSPHEPEEENDPDSNTIPVMYKHGLFYLSDLVISDRVWRLPTTRLPSADDLIVFYRAPDMASLRGNFNAHHALVTRTTTRNAHRTNNRRAVTMDVHHIRGDDDGHEREDINLPRHDIRLRDRIGPQGPDVDNMHEQGNGNSDNDDEDGEDTDSADVAINRIWAQLPYDMISMGPNKKSNRDGSHVLLGAGDASKATMDIFRTLDMSRIFRQIQARLCDDATWEVIFSRYFPAKSFPTPERGGMQGFPYMKFWQSWRTLTSRLSHADTETIRTALRGKWKTLKWIPHATSDRAWETKQAKGRAFVRVPTNSTGPCPQIAINPRFIAEYKQIKLANANAPSEHRNRSDDSDSDENA
jgi:hypothetical protein